MTMDRIQRRIESLLDEADAALVEDDWTTVLNRSEKVLALDPDNAEALTFKAAAERSLGDSHAEPLAPTPPARNAPDIPSVSAPEPTSFASARWGLYLASFILGLAIFVIGLSLANTPLTFAGVIVAAIGFFSRKIVKRSTSGPKGHSGEGGDDQWPTDRP